MISTFFVICCAIRLTFPRLWPCIARRTVLEYTPESVLHKDVQVDRSRKQSAILATPPASVLDHQSRKALGIRRARPLRNQSALFARHGNFDLAN